MGLALAALLLLSVLAWVLVSVSKNCSVQRIASVIPTPISQGTFLPAGIFVSKIAPNEEFHIRQLQTRDFFGGVPNFQVVMKRAASLHVNAELVRVLISRGVRQRVLGTDRAAETALDDFCRRPPHVGEIHLHSNMNSWFERWERPISENHPRWFVPCGHFCQLDVTWQRSIHGLTDDSECPDVLVPSEHDEKAMRTAENVLVGQVHPESQPAGLQDFREPARRNPVLHRPEPEIEGMASSDTLVGFNLYRRFRRIEIAEPTNSRYVVRSGAPAISKRQDDDGVLRHSALRSKRNVEPRYVGALRQSQGLFRNIGAQSGRVCGYSHRFQEFLHGARRTGGFGDGGLHIGVLASSYLVHLDDRLSQPLRLNPKDDALNQTNDRERSSQTHQPPIGRYLLLSGGLIISGFLLGLWGAYQPNRKRIFWTATFVGFSLSLTGWLFWLTW